MWILRLLACVQPSIVRDPEFDHGCRVDTSRALAPDDDAAGVAPADVLAALDGSVVSMVLDPLDDSAVATPLTVAWTLSVSADAWRLEDRTAHVGIQTCIEGRVARGEGVAVALDSDDLWTEGPPAGVAPDRLTAAGPDPDAWWLGASWSASSSTALAEATFPGCSETPEWSIAIQDLPESPWALRPVTIGARCDGVVGSWAASSAN